MVSLLAFAVLATGARAGDRGRIEAFLQVTGFDVALESIRLSANAAPRMLGAEAEDFGSQWSRVADKVFDTDTMHALAIDLLEPTLTDELLGHAAEFYASDLGLRLVEVENRSHLSEDDESDDLVGRALVAEMVQDGDPRLSLLRRQLDAINSIESGLRMVQELQIRFLMAAAVAGAIEMRLDEDEIRARFKQTAGRMRMTLLENTLASAAYTYRDISDADLETYAEALEQPLMQRVYELMNAVQFEVMADRFELMAAEMAGMMTAEEI